VKIRVDIRKELLELVSIGSFHFHTKSSRALRRQRLKAAGPGKLRAKLNIRIPSSSGRSENTVGGAILKDIPTIRRR
jgi:hypothetical protein